MKWLVWGMMVAGSGVCKGSFESWVLGRLTFNEMVDDLCRGMPEGNDRRIVFDRRSKERDMSW